ncbi:MAG: histidine kinase [Bacteroidota bacterium]
MKESVSLQKKLLTFALISSPLIALFSFLPLILLFETLISQTDFSLQRPITDIGLLGRFVGGIFAVSISVFIIWLINISLLNIFQKRQLSQFRLLRYLVSYIFSLSFIGLILLIRSQFVSTPMDIGYIKYYPIVGGLANTTFILILIDLLVNQQARSELELEKAQLEISNLVARQEQLKQQIHPHFLFNSLSTMGSLIKREPNEAYVYVNKLAGFLRNSLTMAQEDLVSVNKELSYFEAYMQLQKTRFGTAISYEVSLSEATRTLGKLPVFTLQLLGENAIKHNAFSTETPLTLLIEEKDGCIWVSNNVIPKYSTEETTQVGLMNLSNRYVILGSSPPKILELDRQFSVILNIL